MASNLLKPHVQISETATPQTKGPLTKTLSSHSFPFRSNHSQFSFHKFRAPQISIIRCSSSSPSLSNPPTSKEAAILQAKTCISTTLEKPLNNTKLTNKFKKLKQPRLQVEIPIIDDSPESLSQLAFEVFRDLPIKRKGSPINILIIWPDISLKEAALKIFKSNPSNPVQHMDIASLSISTNTRILNSVDVSVFLVPEASQLAVMKDVADNVYPSPVVIFNPRWGFKDEDDFGELKGFVGSFEVIYSFMGLEVRGLLSKRKGVVFKCVRDGVVSGERWAVHVEEEGGDFKVVSTFKVRPSIGEVETVLYNLMAMNSPVTKSVKFLRDLVSNVTGKK